MYLSLREIAVVIANDTVTAEHAHKKLLNAHKGMCDLKGYGHYDTIKYTNDLGEEVEDIILDRPQIIMVSSKLNVKARLALVRSLLALKEGDVIHEVIEAKIHRLRHTYSENRNAFSTMRPLINLITPSHDVEYYPATMYHLCEILSMQTVMQRTLPEVLDLMKKSGVISQEGIPMFKGVKERPHYIEHSDGTFKVVRSYAFTVSGLNTALSLIKGGDE